MNNSKSVEARIDEKEVLRREREWLQVTKDEGLSALCLSGGGIRSATFCLGVLQSLAHKGLLDKFHYLSTVSGGGYIGSWLSAWIVRERSQAKVMEQLANQGRTREPEPVRRLRAYSNYLSPVWGLSADFLSMVAIFLRNLALNWLVLVPLFIAAAMLPRLQLAIVNSGKPGPLAYYSLLAASIGLLVCALAYVIADMPGKAPPQAPAKPPANRFKSLCFLPLLGAGFILSWLIAWDAGALLALRWPQQLPAWIYFALVGGVLHLVAIGCGAVWRVKRRTGPLGFDGWDALAALVAGGVAGLLLYGLLLGMPPGPEATAREWYVTWSTALLLLAFWVASTVYTALSSRIKDEDVREWWSRATAWWLGAGLAWLAAAMLVIEAPRLVFYWMVQQGSPAAPAATGTLAALLGVAVSAAGYWSKVGGKLRTKTQTLKEATGLRLVNLLSLAFVIVALVAASIAASCALRLPSRWWGDADGMHQRVVRAQREDAAMLQSAGMSMEDVQLLKTAVAEGKKDQAPLAARAHVAYSMVLEQSTPGLVLLAMASLALFGVVFSRWVGVNTFSLHSMYGNRLTRAYLGASNLQRKPHPFTGFDPEDSLPMTEGASRPKSEKPRLFHVINAALNIVAPAGDRLEWQQRKAAPFTMSPLHCGSAELGYAPTKGYDMSYARAMAISGAAASPNMGYHTSKLVAFVMTLFNARLGWWVPNPRADKHEEWGKREPRFGVKAMLDELLARASADRNYVYVSDGGHFENLGLYEMLRRRCGKILVVDASCDPTCGFDDLEGAIRKARVDFGVTITFGEADPLPTLERAKTSKRYIAVGEIQYPDAPAGQLVYLKPVLTGDEPLDVLRFAANHSKDGKAFPHQPTSDQFFDESQFESYRMLGKHAADRHFSDNWEKWLRQIPPVAESAGEPGPITTQHETTSEEALNMLQAFFDQVRLGRKSARRAARGDGPVQP